MKKIVFTIKDDVCNANGKDQHMQCELVAKMGQYGTVEDYDQHISRIKAEYQDTYDKLVAQYKAVQDRALTDDEMAIVTIYRKLKEGIKAEDKQVIEMLTGQLEKIKQENENRVAQIKALLG